MRKALMLAVASVAALNFQPAHAIEYNELQPVQRFPGNGWLVQSGTDHGVEFKSYLESKRLLVAPDAIYYVGTVRIETADGTRLRSVRLAYTLYPVPEGNIHPTPINAEEFNR